MKRRARLSVALLLAAAATASAQQVSERCNNQNAFDYLGITAVECRNCSFDSDNGLRTWRFSSEPRIARVDPDSRAAAFLRTGDLIAEVNHKAITTPGGANALANLKRGESVVLTVKRDGKLLQYALMADAECRASDNWSVLPKIAAPVAAPSPSAAAPAAAPAAQIPGVRAPIMPGVPTPALAGFNYRGPRASYGMSIRCSDCWTKLSDESQSWSMGFSRPPAVYSVERGGPADKAGIRRGDVITRVNGKAIDSEAGGRAFASARPGDKVSFTVKRGKETKTFVVQPIDRPVLAGALAASTHSLNSAGETLDDAARALIELQRSQMREAQRQMELAQRQDNLEAMRAAQRALLSAQKAHRLQIDSIAAQMAAARHQMQAALADAERTSCRVAAVAPVAAGTPGTRTLRYTGNMGGANVEVRGAPVSVSETEDEIVITTGATVVRIQKRK